MFEEGEPVPVPVPVVDQPHNAQEVLDPPADDGDGQEFAPLPDWPDLGLSDDELLDEDEREDEIEEQAAQAQRRLQQLVVQCPICLGAAVNRHVSPCGHICCFTCWRGAGIGLFNEPRAARPADPALPEEEPRLPGCPVCRAPIQFLIKIFPEPMLPLQQILDEENDLQALANADLNPAIFQGVLPAAPQPQPPVAPPVAHPVAPPVAHPVAPPVADPIRGRGRGRGVRVRGGGRGVANVQGFILDF